MEMSIVSSPLFHGAMMGLNIEIRNIEQPADIVRCHAVMMQLRPHMKDADAFVRQVMRQREQGFRLSAACCGDRIAGLVGYRLQENLLYGRFVFVDDLIVHEEVRSSGVGAELLAVARAYAREESCRYFVLDTGLHMALAQRFYYRQGLLAHAMGFCEMLVDSEVDGSQS
ncbi:MAG: GNAT family N-acetyltransferase [Dongiaceae bacterium]